MAGMKKATQTVHASPRRPRHTHTHAQLHINMQALNPAGMCVCHAHVNTARRRHTLLSQYVHAKSHLYAHTH